MSFIQARFYSFTLCTLVDAIVASTWQAVDAFLSSTTQIDWICFVDDERIIKLNFILAHSRFFKQNIHSLTIYFNGAPTLLMIMAHTHNIFNYKVCWVHDNSIMSWWCENNNKKSERESAENVRLLLMCWHIIDNNVLSLQER